MIAAKPPTPADFAARLAEQARRLAEVHGEHRWRSPDPARWRDPRLLWPLATKGS